MKSAVDTSGKDGSKEKALNPDSQEGIRENKVKMKKEEEEEVERGEGEGKGRRPRRRKGRRKERKVCINAETRKVAIQCQKFYSISGRYCIDRAEEEAATKVGQGQSMLTRNP